MILVRQIDPTWIIGKEDPTAPDLATTPSSGFAPTPPSPTSVRPIENSLWYATRRALNAVVFSCFAFEDLQFFSAKSRLFWFFSDNFFGNCTVKKWHPDRWAQSPAVAGEAKRRFQQIQEAYSGTILSPLPSRRQVFFFFWVKFVCFGQFCRTSRRGQCTTLGYTTLSRKKTKSVPISFLFGKIRFDT